MKRFLAAALILTALVTALVVNLYAQTVSYKIGWHMVEVASVAQGFQYVMRDNGTVTGTITPACVNVTPTGSDCSSPLPVLVAGTHVITLTASNAFGSATSDPLNGVPASKPTTVTVTIQVGP